ncbi:MAG: pirin family protein [Pseudobdellovibrio sp.]
MIKVRKSNERGKANHGWLNSMHTFSFADYHDPQFMGFSVLRVINEDRISGGSGFSTHGHKDMEIISYVISGALEHKDSMGNAGVIKPGELQRMSAGTGIRHSEMNHLKSEETHFLQIWVLPDQANRAPSYGQKDFSAALSTGEVTLVASNTGRNNSVSLNQDVDIYALKSSQMGERILNTDETRSYWLQIIKGVVKFNEVSASAGDAVSATMLTRIHLQWSAGSEFILFDLP